MKLPSLRSRNQDLGHSPVMARASRCGKAAAFAGEHRNPPRL
jgi:hypothetical protein